MSGYAKCFVCIHSFSHVLGGKDYYPHLDEDADSGTATSPRLVGGRPGVQPKSVLFSHYRACAGTDFGAVQRTSRMLSKSGRKA